MIGFYHYCKHHGMHHHGIMLGSYCLFSGDDVDIIESLEMSEEHESNDYIPLINGTKSQRYQRVRQEFQARLDPTSHPLANTSNLLNILKLEFKWWWIGFYWVYRTNGNEFLTLGEFQGPPACTKIFKGKGVCGTAWQEKRAIVVQDVSTFKGHIACSSASKSEVVIPILLNDEVIGVLDVDSEHLNHFNEQDQKELIFLLGVIGKIGQWEWYAKHL